MYYFPLTISNNFFDREKLVSTMNINPREFFMTRQWHGRTDLLSEDFHKWLDSLDCNVFFAELFYTPPGGKMIWHIDTEAPSNFVKINFVWGSKYHIMQWGVPIKEIPKSEKFTSADTKYLSFGHDELRIVAMTKIETPTVVNIGTPHRVINTDQTGRWCLSINIHKDGNRIPINEAKTIFSEYVLD